MLPEPDEAIPTAQAIALDIRFEDAHLIVVDKPAGMVVHPAPGNPEGTLVNALLAHCGPSLAGIGGVRRPGIVHRLDKDTSGLLVAAKTETAHRALSHDFALRRRLPMINDLATNVFLGGGLLAYSFNPSELAARCVSEEVEDFVRSAVEVAAAELLGELVAHLLEVAVVPE